LQRQTRYHLSSAQSHDRTLTGFNSALGGKDAAVTKALDGVYEVNSNTKKSMDAFFGYTLLL
jgi:hypothetical protein